MKKLKIQFIFTLCVFFVLLNTSSALAETSVYCEVEQVPSTPFPCSTSRPPGVVIVGTTSGNWGGTTYWYIPIGEEPSGGISPCSVTATANPNPIPQDQNQTTLDYNRQTAVGVNHCFLEERREVGPREWEFITHNLPYTVSQTNDFQTYKIECIGDYSDYSPCGDSITVTKGTSPTTSPSNLTSSLEYSWSKPGTYNVYVEGKDLNGSAVKSNTVIITVLDTCLSGEKKPHNICNSSAQCVSDNSCGTDQCDSSHPCPLPPPPTCSVSLTASPKIILLGRSLTLAWSMNDACSGCQALCSYSDDTNAYPQCGPEWKGLISSTSGNKSVTPQAKGTYTYTISCNDGTASANVTVQVIPSPWWREIIPNLQGFLRGLIR